MKILTTSGGTPHTTTKGGWGGRIDIQISGLIWTP